jgi:DNA (cytosine-5)-methyltransferase 1
VGFEESGFDIKLAVDNNIDAVKTYNRNLGRVAERIDVESLEFCERIKSLGTVDVLLGGFPCQGFSKSGPKNFSDPRNGLFMSMVRAAEITEPKVIIAENVDGLKQNFGGSALAEIKEAFAVIGYDMKSEIVDFVSYGLPQHRRRIIFIGTRSGQQRMDMPLPTHSYSERNGEFSLGTSLPLFETEKRQCISICDAIEDLGEGEDVESEHIFHKKYPKAYRHIFKSIGPGQKLCDVRNAETSVHSWQIPEYYGETSSEERRLLDAMSTHRRLKKYGDVPNGNPLRIIDLAKILGIDEYSVENLVCSLLSKKYIKEKLWGYDLCNATFNSGIFKRPQWDMPSPTVLTNFYNPRFFIHPIFDRPFTVREAARLQTFPDSFSFLENTCSEKELIEAFRQIGNAVPPVFSRALARVTRDYLCRNGLPRYSSGETNQQVARLAA